jgi:putative transposase
VARPLRLEVEDGFYHVVARGNERRAIFKDDTDRQRFLEILGRTLDRFAWRCLAYCLMTNHYHLLVCTPRPNLARGMRDLNGVYAQWFNRRHARVGHLFQGRYRAILVERDEYLLQSVAYIVRNPVRAGFCESPRDWHWSSHRAALGERRPGVLAVAELMDLFGGRLGGRERYCQLTEDVSDARDGRPGDHVIEGTDIFHQRMLAGARSSPDIPSKQLRPPSPPLDVLLRGPDTGEVLAAAYEHGYTMPAIARHLGIHPSTVSRRLARHRAQIKT